MSNIIIQSIIQSIVDITNLSDGNENKGGSPSDDSSFNYFDELHGGPNLEHVQHISPLVKHWKKKILVDDSMVRLSTTLEMLMSYWSIRTELILPVLKNKLKHQTNFTCHGKKDFARMEGFLRYEMLLAFIVSETVSTNLSPTSIIAEKESTEGVSKMERNLEIDEDILRFDGIFEIMRIVSKDISACSKAMMNMKKLNTNMADDTRIVEILISLLIRVLIHATRIIHVSSCFFQDKKKILTQSCEILSNITLISLTFLPSSRIQYKRRPDFSTATPDSICTLDIIPNLLHSKFSFAVLIKSCAFPPEIKTAKKYDSQILQQILSPSSIVLASNENNNYKLNQSLLDTQFLPKETAIWAKSGIVRRVAFRLLQSIDDCASSLKKTKTSNAFLIQPDTSQTIPEHIIHCLDPDIISRSCNQYFFDKSINNSIIEEAQLDSQPYLFLPHIHGTLSLITYLPSLLTLSSMNHILPISYALLDNYNPYYQSIGAALLLHILHRSTPENLYMHWENLESITDNVWKGGCRDKMWNVAFLLLARTELMEMLKQYDTTTTNHTRVTNPRKTMVSTPPMMSIAAKRRKFSQELFIKLKKRLFSRSSKDYPVVDQNLNEDENNDNEAVNIGRDEEDMITPLLLAGICPLLAQHTAMGTRNDEQRRDADAMEISTDGLSALLFLMESLEWEISHVSPDVEKLWILPISTIIALISLLMSTHPIMKYHGGKIMCALLSILGNCDKNIQNYHNNNLPRSITIEHANLFISFTIHAASIALVICGKLAENVLDKVEETCVDSLVHRCIEIREVAKQLMLQTENN